MRILFAFLAAISVSSSVQAEDRAACEAYDNHIEYHAPGKSRAAMFECGLHSQAGGIPLLAWRQKKLLVTCNDHVKAKKTDPVTATFTNEVTGETYRVSVSPKSQCRNYELCRDKKDEETGAITPVCSEYPENAMISVLFGSTKLCAVAAGNERIHDIASTYKLGKVSPNSPPLIPLPLSGFPGDVKTAYGSYIEACWPDNWDGVGLSRKEQKEIENRKKGCDAAARTYWKSVEESYAASCPDYILAKTEKALKKLNKQGAGKGASQTDLNKQSLVPETPSSQAGSNSGKDSDRSGTVQPQKN